MNKLSVQNVSKTVAGQALLKNISFDVEPGSITAIIGPSGAGKTTLLRSLCQLETIDSGQIQLNGKSTGIVFQQYYLWKHLTLLENCILAPMQVRKCSKQEAILEAQQLLAQLGILDKEAHYPNQLSGGEQQRAAIVRALMMKPELLLFDEPTSALDPERTGSVLNIIQSLAKQGMTIIVVTHDTQFARKIASQIIFLEAGKIIDKTLVKSEGIVCSNRLTQFLNLSDPTFNTPQALEETL